MIDGDLTQLITTQVAQALACSEEELLAAMDQDLEGLGMDSHNLMRCQLDIEAACGVEELILDDAALMSPRSLIEGLRTAVRAQQ